MATVIDALIVTLGLDASKYKQGREEAEKETGETARKAQLAADAITKSLTEVGRTIAGLFLGFESASGFGKFLGSLNQGEADLGRTASTLGITAHELNKYGLAARYAGQDSASVAAAFKSLTDAAVKYQSGQGTSPILDLMRQAQVSVFDTTGKLRNQGEVYEELARKTAAWGSQMQAARFGAAGISDGEIRFLIQSQKLRDDNYRLAEKNNSVNADSVAKAQALQEYWRNIGVQVESVGQKILSSLTPAIKGAFAAVSNMMAAFKDSGGLDRLIQAMKIVGNIAGAIGGSIKAWAAGFENSPLRKFFDTVFNLYGKAADLLSGSHVTPARPSSGPATPQVAPDLGFIPPTYRNHNPGNLRQFRPGQPTDSRGFRTFANDAEGKKALEDDLRAKMTEGLKTISAIISKYAPDSENDTAGYISAVAKSLHKNANATLTEADIRQLAQAITTHEGTQIRTAKGDAAGSTTTVQVDAIHVHSNATSPRAVAEQIPAAIQRKMDVAQAAQGQS